MPKLPRFARPNDEALPPPSGAGSTARRVFSGAATQDAVAAETSAPRRSPGSPAPGWTDPQNQGLARRDPVASIPYELQVAAGYAWRFIVVAVALWGLGQILAATTTVVIPVAVALLLTGLLMPVAVLLNHKARLPRHAAAAVTVLGFIALVVGLMTLAGTQLVSGVTDLVDQAGLGLDQLQTWLKDGPLHLGGDQVSQYIEQARAYVKEHSSSLTTGAMHGASTATEFLAGLLISLISTFFFLAEGDRIWSWVVRLLPAVMQQNVHEGFRRGWVTLGSYTKTQCIVAAVDACFITIGAWILGLPLLIPMGLIIFFGSFVPIIGSVVAASLAVLVALFVKGAASAVIMLGIILLVQQVEGHILQPVLMSKAVALHPLAVILGVGLGSFLFGIVGALFTVPFLAFANTVFLYWAGHDKFPALAEGESAVGVSAKKLAGEKGPDKDAVDDVEKEEKERTHDIGSASPWEGQRAADRESDAREAAADGAVQDS